MNYFNFPYLKHFKRVYIALQKKQIKFSDMNQEWKNKLNLLLKEVKETQTSHTTLSNPWKRLRKELINEALDFNKSNINAQGLIKFKNKKISK